MLVRAACVLGLLATVPLCLFFAAAAVTDDAEFAITAIALGAASWWLLGADD